MLVVPVATNRETERMGIPASMLVAPGATNRETEEVGVRVTINVMKLGYALLILPLCGFSCVSAPPKPHVAPGRYVKTIQEGSIQRSYILRTPKGYDNKRKVPLVLMFHGLGSSAEEAESFTGLTLKAEKEGFILVIPNGTPGIGDMKGWNTGFLDLGSKDVDDVKFTTDILDQVEHDLYIDDKRVFVAGHSNGAMMAYDLGSALSGRIAAIAVVSGSVGIGDKRVPGPTSPVSAIIFHGKADQMVAYDSSSSALLQAISAPESAKWWAEKDGCGPMTETRRGNDVVLDDYRNGKGSSEVELVTIVKGDHAWPDGTRTPVAAADLIWSFFKAHPKS
ncbi:MAG TPA: PHB depolymerase family esterase [Fimbriimonadaceae bacterium]|nr:PHB depolymerase family esterase [Fimbriimonadaceae bacterium]